MFFSFKSSTVRTLRKHFSSIFFQRKEAQPAPERQTRQKQKRQARSQGKILCLLPNFSRNHLINLIIRTQPQLPARPTSIPGTFRTRTSSHPSTPRPQNFRHSPAQSPAMATEQINEQYLVSALREKLQAETVEVTDVSGMLTAIFLPRMYFCTLC